MGESAKVERKWLKVRRIVVICAHFYIGTPPCHLPSWADQGQQDLQKWEVAAGPGGDVGGDDKADGGGGDGNTNLYFIYKDG